MLVDHLTGKMSLIHRATKDEFLDDSKYQPKFMDLHGRTHTLDHVPGGKRKDGTATNNRPWIIRQQIWYVPRSSQARQHMFQYTRGSQSSGSLCL